MRRRRQLPRRQSASLQARQGHASGTGGPEQAAAMASAALAPIEEPQRRRSTLLTGRWAGCFAWRQQRRGGGGQSSARRMACRQWGPAYGGEGMAAHCRSMLRLRRSSAGAQPARWQALSCPHGREDQDDAPPHVPHVGPPLAPLQCAPSSWEMSSASAWPFTGARLAPRHALRLAAARAAPARNAVQAGAPPRRLAHPPGVCAAGSASVQLPGLLSYLICS